MTLIATPVISAWLLARLPPDYFASESSRVAEGGNRHPLLHALYVLFKNACGVLFILIGLALLVLPGQGLLSILVGVLLLDFPGKYRLERRFVKKPSVLKSINWLRQKAKRPPFLLDSVETERVVKKTE